MNLPLKIALLEKGFSQFDLSRLLGMDPGKLSRIVNQWVEPDNATKQKISHYLGKSISELFPETEARGAYADPR